MRRDGPTLPPHVGDPPDGQEGQRISGHVKWFDSAKGYGFVKPVDRDADILLHQSCVRHSGFKAIREGATVVCEAVPARAACRRPRSSRLTIPPPIP